MIFDNLAQANEALFDLCYERDALKARVAALEADCARLIRKKDEAEALDTQSLLERDTARAEVESLKAQLAEAQKVALF